MPRSKQSRAKKAKTVTSNVIPQTRSSNKLPNEVLEKLLRFIPENRHVAKVNSVDKFGAVRCDHLWHLRFVSQRWLSIIQRICSKFELHVEVKLGEKVGLAKASVHYCIGGVILPPKPLRDVVQYPIRMPGLYIVKLIISFGEWHDFRDFPDWFAGAMRYIYESVIEVYVNCNNSLPLLLLTVRYSSGTGPVEYEEPLPFAEGADFSKLMDELPWRVHSLEMATCQAWMFYRITGFADAIRGMFQAVATNLKALDVRFDVLGSATPPGAVVSQASSLTLHGRPALEANEASVDGLSRALGQLPAVFPSLRQLEFVNLLIYSSTGVNLAPLLALSELKALRFSKRGMNDLWHAGQNRTLDVDHSSVRSLQMYVCTAYGRQEYLADVGKLIKVARSLESLEIRQGEKQLLRDFADLASHAALDLSNLRVLRLEMLPQIFDAIGDTLLPLLQGLPVKAPRLEVLSVRITDFDGLSAFAQADLKEVLQRLPPSLRHIEMSGLFPDEQLLQDWQHGPETRRGARIGVNYEADAGEMLRVLDVVVASAPQLTSFAWLDAFCANTSRWTVSECEKLSAVINKQIKRASKRKNANFKSLRTFVNYVDKTVQFYIENTTTGNRQKLSFGVNVGYRF